jgi:hypothetical protein
VVAGRLVSRPKNLLAGQDAMLQRFRSRYAALVRTRRVQVSEQDISFALILAICAPGFTPLFGGAGISPHWLFAPG